MAAKKTGTKKKAIKKKASKKASKKAVKKTSKKTTKKASRKTASKKKVANKKASSISSKTPQVGRLAPAFSLPNQDGKIISLKDFKGKKHVVLYFYPRAMTPGCTVQACGIRDKKSAISRAGAVVLGVSPDKLASLEKFRKRDKLNFDLLSDEETSLAKAYGVWGLKKFMGREFMGIRRWTFIIGKDGKVKHVMDKVNTKTHHDDVLDILKSL